jgi:MoxR-like ATPase
VDEINRADIDKSFGQLFTLLSGQSVQLPFKKGGNEIEIVPARQFEGSPGAHQYVVPESWRILATMNTYDKTSLYEMSYAFMRRFSFIYVDVPAIPEDREERVALLSEYAETWGLTPGSETLDGVSEIWFVTNNAVENREIGPAIIRDILQHVNNSSTSTETAITQAVANHIFPQLEGVPQRERIVAQIINRGPVDANRLEELAGDMLQVSLNE